MTLKIPFIPRDRDTKILGWVKRRAAGVTCQEIADSEGIQRASVIAATNKVCAADLAESGEEISREYW